MRLQIAPASVVTVGPTGVVMRLLVVLMLAGAVAALTESQFVFQTRPDFSTTVMLNVSSLPDSNSYVKADFPQGSLEQSFQAPLYYSMVTDALTDEQVFDGLEAYEEYLARK